MIVHSLVRNSCTSTYILFSIPFVLVQYLPVVFLSEKQLKSIVRRVLHIFVYFCYQLESVQVK